MQMYYVRCFDARLGNRNSLRRLPGRVVLIEMPNAEDAAVNSLWAQAHLVFVFVIVNIKEHSNAPSRRPDVSVFKRQNFSPETGKVGTDAIYSR